VQQFDGNARNRAFEASELEELVWRRIARPRWMAITTSAVLETAPRSTKPRLR
jgi:hypothetical protein